MTRPSKKNTLTKEDVDALRALYFLTKPQKKEPDEFSKECAVAIAAAKTERNGARTTKYGTMSL